MRPGRLKDVIGWGAARPDYAAGLRAATATILPLTIGEATGRHQLIWMALGGWLAIFTDPGGPYPLRARTMGAFALTGAASLAAGCAIGGHPWPSVALLFVWAAGCSLLRVYGDAPGGVGTLSLITFCIGLGSPATGAQALALRSALLAAGALWAGALCVAFWPVQPYRPVRRAVAACHRALAQHLRALATGAEGWFDASARSRGAIRVQLEAARAIVGSVRGGRRGDSRRSDLLVAIYEAAELALGDLSAVAETLQSLADRGDPRPAWCDPALEKAAVAFEAVAEAAGEARVAVSRPALELGEGELAGPMGSLASHLLLAAQAAAALQGQAPADPVPRIELKAAARRSIRDALSYRSIDLRNAVRVAATASAAAALGILMAQPRRYWIIVTAVIVLQPHAGATVRRGLQRIAGTVAGAMAAALLAPFVHTQLRVALVMFALALAAAALRRHNYAVYAALMTPLFVLMAESTSGDWHLARTRIISTLLGGLVALVGSFGFWPQHERARLPGEIAQLLRIARGVLQAAIAGQPIAAARREAGVALANADASFERFLDESHQDHEAEALMAIRSQLRRLAGAIVALSSGGRLPDALLPAVQAASDTLAVMAQAVDERRPPPALAPFPTSPHAERLARPVEVIHGALGRLAALGTF